MIHLDSYEWAGQTYIRAWDTEEFYSSEDLIALLGPTPKEVMPNEGRNGNESECRQQHNSAITGDAHPSKHAALRITEVPEVKSFWHKFWSRV